MAYGFNFCRSLFYLSVESVDRQISFLRSLGKADKSVETTLLEYELFIKDPGSKRTAGINIYDNGFLASHINVLIKAGSEETVKVACFGTQGRPGHYATLRDIV